MGHVRWDVSAIASLVLVITLATSLCVYGQEVSDREREGLVGPVHTILVEIALVKCKSRTCTEGERVVQSKHQFEPHGSHREKRGAPSVIDPLSRMRSYPFDESIPRIEKPTYGENGLLLYTDVYTYDNKGRRAEHVSYDSTGVVRYKELALFDKCGKLAELNNYDGNGRLEAWVKHVRDGQCNVIESEEGEGPFRRKLVSTYEFDYMGNWIRSPRLSSVYRDGRLISESSVVYYRTFTYY
jgi:hypothetical protein